MLAVIQMAGSVGIASRAWDIGAYQGGGCGDGGGGGREGRGDGGGATAASKHGRTVA